MSLISAIKYHESRTPVATFSFAKYETCSSRTSRAFFVWLFSLRILARSSASRAIREKKPIRLEYMNARERRIIHEELSSSSKVTTASEGVEPKRYVVVSPIRQKKNEEKEETPRDNND